MRHLKMRLTSLIKAVLFYGGFFALLRLLFPNRRAALLRYHAVVDPADNLYTSPSISLPVRAFERHVRYFARKYRVLSLDHVVEAVLDGRPLPKNAVVFTFDDGYADNLIAARILKKYGATGIFYLTTDCIDRRETLWLAEVNYLLARSAQPVFRLELEGTTREFALRTPREREQAKRAVIKIIKSNDRRVRETVRQQLRAQLATADWPAVADRIMLTWEQVREMLALGMSIGGHTVSHLNLPNAAPEDARREIAGCKHKLEAVLNLPIRHFSVPNSGPYRYYNAQVKRMVGECGFVSSVTSAHGFVDGDSDLLELRRIRTIPALHEVVATIELGKFSRNGGESPAAE
ncbi:MAG: polysaccharide deacetylase family protein [candidate division KSB1 bacterium]|nr:polysaccharide deacetylase family protein [candidate division KSB1 bacterium]MDZ7272781.1 polysaccharide deacetylase family protein [candidate division KSB1 bacterium]MDZ7284195.1 polysaccharide deacetylase family protein [candidate division KSB1 bacterium]MDZ7297407.1 polysaccharide deacetylase family protein [candidate division KSB1 bacterium]MDZ7306533.1 polysaccharide deacetylase family protein [candidate division KSB1 bacterium]